MTMPHLMNCQHTAEGWCLDCVGEQHAELERLRAQVAPTVEDINAQDWAGMDGATAYQLIDRHGEDWSHIGRLMESWRAANAAPAQQALSEYCRATGCAHQAAQCPTWPQGERPPYADLAATAQQAVDNNAPGNPGCYPAAEKTTAQQADTHSCHEACDRPGCVEARQSSTVGDVPAVVRSAPARIWLQVSDDAAHMHVDFPRSTHGDEVTWSPTRALDCEVEYVRADLAQPAAQAEPVVWRWKASEHFDEWVVTMDKDIVAHATKLGYRVEPLFYAAPPKPAAQGIDELAEMLRDAYHAETKIGHPMWKNVSGPSKAAWLSVARAALAQAPAA